MKGIKMNAKVIVIGANSAIAQAVIKRHIEENSADDKPNIMAVSRENRIDLPPQCVLFNCDYSESDIELVSRELIDQADFITHLYIFNGVLHNDEFMPEKRLQNINSSQLLSQFHTNAIVPMLWIKNLLPLLKKGQANQERACVVTVLNARVGSLSDNQLGGWYSYRSSKAALNMMLKNAAIELARTAPKVKLLSFHPGTTDTPLSKPFQKNVPSGKLFSPDFVAERLFHVHESLVADGELSYRDWNNCSIPW